MNARYAFKDKGVEWRCPCLDVIKVEFEGGYLSLYSAICDRDTGERITQQFNCDLPKSFNYETATPQEVAGLIRSAYLLLVNHELEELLRVDGMWQDPHVRSIRVEYKVKFE